MNNWSFVDDLKKSRIQNLPSYRKINLGDCPQFAIVFQTIEIQRLSNQVEVVRGKMKEAQHLLFNAQNYEVQIKQLTQKTWNHENQLSEYRTQFEKLNKACSTLYQENALLKSKLNEMDISLKQKYEIQKQKNLDLQQQVEKWKNRYQAAEASRARELEDLRNVMDCQRKSMINRDIRQITIKFENQRSSLQNQIRKSRQIITNKTNEIHEIRKKCQQYQTSLFQIKNYKQKIQELQDKAALLSQETIRINELLRDKEELIQQFKKSQYELKLKLKQQIELQQESQHFRALVESKTKETDDWRMRCSRFQEEAVRGKQLIHFNCELNQKLEVSSKQIERLNSALKQKLEQIQKWRSKLQQKEIEFTKLKNIQTQIPQYESKINMQKAQNQRISNILKSRLVEIQNYKKRVGLLEDQIFKCQMIQKDKKEIQNKYSKQIRNNEQLKSTCQKLESDLNAYKKYESRCRELQNTKVALTRETERLNNIIKSSTLEIQDHRQRFKQLEYQLNQHSNIQSQLNEYQNKIVLLTQEIQRLNQLIKNKNQNLDQLQFEKLQLHQKVNYYKKYQMNQNEIDQITATLQNNMEILKLEIQEWQTKYRSSEAKIRQLENGLFASNSQKNKLLTELRNKQNEVEDFKNKYLNSQNEVKQLYELRQIYQQQHNQLTLYANEFQKFEKKNKELENLFTKEKYQNQQLIQQKKSIQKEFDQLKASYESISRQFDANYTQNLNQFHIIQEQLMKVMIKSESKETQIETLLNCCSQLQNQIHKLMDQFRRLLIQTEKSQKEANVLYQKIQEYQEYARKISILDAELNRIERQNKKLEEDNKMMRLKYQNQMTIQKKSEQFDLTTVLMAAEIQSLRQRVNQKQKNFEQMRKSIIDSVRKL